MTTESKAQYNPVRRRDWIKYGLILLVIVFGVILFHTTFDAFNSSLSGGMPPSGMPPDRSPSGYSSVLFILLCLIFVLSILLYRAQMRIKAGDDHYYQGIRYKHLAERFRFTLDAVVNAYWDWHLERGDIEYNGNLMEDLGYPPEQTVDSEFWRKITHPVDRPMIKYKLYQHLQDESNPYHFEYRLLNGEGKYQWYLAKGKVISRNQQGLPVRMVGSIENITERMNMEIDLKDSRQKFLDIFHATPEGMLIIHFESAVVTDINDKMAQMLGSDRAQYNGDSSNFVREWLTSPQQKFFLEELSRSEIYENFETRVEMASGESLVLSVSGKLIKLKGIKHLLLIVEDITKRRRLERSFQEACKMEAVGQLTGGIAHDFNNILASVMGYTELAIDTPFDQGKDKIPAYLEEIQRAGRKATDLVKQLLTFSRFNPTSAKPVYLAEQVDEAIRMVRSTLPASIDIIRDFEEQQQCVNIDPIQLQRVIVNLCVNARDAMDGSGTLTLIIRQSNRGEMECSSCHLPFEGTFQELTIQDSGSGIDQLVLHHMFEPFFTTKEVGKGSGMGLPVVHGILHELGGHILVESIPERGSSIRLLFKPFTQELQATVDRQDSAQNPAVADLKGKRIMVLDDEEPIANFLATVFTQQGCDVTVMTDSRRAFELFEQDPNRFDLVVTDQTMPVINGAELAQEMLNIKPYQPIILCTGYSVHIDEAKANALNIGALLQKPVSTAHLLSVSQRLLTNPRDSSLSGTSP